MLFCGWCNIAFVFGGMWFGFWDCMLWVWIWWFCGLGGFRCYGLILGFGCCHNAGSLDFGCCVGLRGVWVWRCLLYFLFLRVGVI